ncbi:hypothetical protein ACFQ0M_36095 [Kitasatospora aburaviensis]
MSAPIMPAVTAATTGAAVGAATAPDVLDVLRAEGIKLTTLRSLWITPVLSALLTAGVGTAVAAAVGGADASLTDDPGVGVHYGLNFGQAALACFGILLFGQEFNTRMIGVSLAAVPGAGASTARSWRSARSSPWRSVRSGRPAPSPGTPPSCPAPGTDRPWSAAPRPGCSTRCC